MDGLPKEEMFQKRSKSDVTNSLLNGCSDNHKKRHRFYPVFIILLAGVAFILGTVNWSTAVNGQNETSTDQPVQQLIQTSIQSWLAVALGIASIIGVAVKFLETYNKNHTNDTRFIKITEALRMTKDSIEESDKAIKDNADLNKIIINNIANIPQVKEWFERPENKTLIEQANKNADEMAESIKQYYQVYGKMAGDESKDHIIRMVANTEKQLVPGS
ncbi:MAG TPA: hypothetical protein VKA95_10195 [Nitrososphaeraceae archaeon]|nr:hypothetical protein [Nitrososphaeraceae archaeon]